MNISIPLTQIELEDHLKTQLYFLEASSEAYDQGFYDEARRLAVTLRVLLHDTRKSKSLLGLLKIKDCLFYDTASIDNPKNLIRSYHGLTFMRLSFDENEKTAHMPRLDPSGTIDQIEFESWWHQIVIRDASERTLSRKQLILSVADQDGGAHVDSALNEVYAHISRYNSLGIHVTLNGVSTAISHIELASVRQIAHEVLKTLKPGYQKSYPNPPLAAAEERVQMDVAIKEYSQKSQGTVYRSQKIGRNEPCYCGSGVKYKFCHGDPRKKN